jgi:uncharacterized protein (UPF0332 family)
MVIYLDKIDDLYYQGYLKRVEPSPLKSALSLKEAKIWLKESELTYENGFYRSARISVYFAFLHATRAVSLRDGVSEIDSHYLIDYLETYCADGKLKKECLDVLNWIFDLHYQDKYHFQCTRNPQDIQQAIRYCYVFIRNIKVLLEKTAKLPKAMAKNAIRENEFGEENEFENDLNH